MTAGSLTINNTVTLNVQTAYNPTDASILAVGTGTLAMGAGDVVANSALIIDRKSATVTVANNVSNAGALSRLLRDTASRPSA